MPTATEKSRVLETLAQHQQRPVAIEELSSWTGMEQEDLQGIMEEMSKEGTIQRLGNNHYRYSPTPLPKEGASFSGKVTGSSFRGGAIVRDQNGTSWLVEPI